jgi:stringent starvation protein B
MIHLDARRPGVLVPKEFQQEAHLRLNLSYRFDPPDITVSDWGVRSTLSFSGSRFKIAVPWSAIFAITSHATQENSLYPDDMPEELVQQAIAQAKDPAPSVQKLTCAPAPEKEKPACAFREIAGEKKDEGGEPPTTPRPRGHLRLIK